MASHKRKMSISNMINPDSSYKRRRSKSLFPDGVSNITSQESETSVLSLAPVVSTTAGSIEHRTVADEANTGDSETLLQIHNDADTLARKYDEDRTMALLDRLRYVYNSGYDTQGRTGYMEGTRVQILADLESWSNDPDAQLIFWLSGMAGAGKTSIAWSFCDILHRSSRLGGSFFCSRIGNFTRRDGRFTHSNDSSAHNDVRRIIPCLARLLALKLPKFKSALAMQLEEDPDASERPIASQIRFLLQDPLSRVPFRDIPSLVFVVDALDECSEKDATRDMLNALVASVPPLPIKFFVTSRPELPIRNALLSVFGDIKRILRLQDIEKTVVDADIRRYISQSLTGSPCEPPLELTDRDIECLVTFSGALFICASTAIKYIRGGFSPERLSRLTSLSFDRRGPLTQPLDAMYRLILTETLYHDKDTDNFEEDELIFLRQVLAAILAMRSPLSISTLAVLLGKRSEHLRQTLKNLHAVIHIPEDDNDPSIFTLHASFPDFLTSRASSDIRINIVDGHNTLAQGCLKRLDDDLHFNISQTLTSYLPNTEQKLARIPTALLYAYLNCLHHISVAAADEISLSTALEEVLQKKFLYWVEALSVSGLVEKASYAIFSVLNAPRLREALAPDFAHFLRSANEFVLYFQEAIEASACHIYLSALPFTPPSSRVALQYTQSFRFLPKVRIQGMIKRRSPILILKHSSPVYSTSFSPDGTRIVSGSYDEKVRVWDAQTGELGMLPLTGHTRRVISVSFSPDGKQIVSGSYDETIRVWNAQTRELAMPPLTGHTGGVSSVSFSPDGTRIVSGSYDKTIRVWDAQTGELSIPPLTGHTASVTCVSFSPDGKRIVSGSYDKTILVWDVQTGKLAMLPLTGHTNWVMSVSCSLDGKWIVSSSYDKTLRVWDAQSGKLAMLPLIGHTDCVTSVAFSPNGKQIVSSSRDKTIRVWDAQSGEPAMPPLTAHTDYVISVAFSPNGVRIVSSSEDQTIRIWDMQSGELAMRPLAEHTDCVTSVAFSPDGKRVVSGSEDKTIRVWDMQTGELAMRPLAGHTDRATSVAFSPDGTRIASGSEDKTIRVCDMQTGELAMPPLTGHTAWVTSVAFSPDGTRIVSGSEDMTVRVWDVQTGELAMPPLTGHTAWIMSVTFSPNGERIASGSEDQTIRLWNAKTGMLAVQPLRGHTDCITSVAFSPEGNRIVSGSHDQTILVWRVLSGRLAMAPLMGHTTSVTSVAFSPDGKRIVSGSSGRTIRVWEVPSGKLAMRPLRGHADGVMSVAFSPDGKQIVSGSYDKTIRVWDVRLSELAMPPLTGHTNYVTSMAFSPSKTQILTCCEEGTICMHNVRQIGTSSAARDKSKFIQVSHESNSEDGDSRSRTPVDLSISSLDTSSGWFCGSQGERILWIPPEFRDYIDFSPEGRVLCARVLIDFSDIVHGADWTKCFDPNAAF